MGVLNHIQIKIWDCLGCGCFRTIIRNFETINKMQVRPTPINSAPIVYSFARVAPTLKSKNYTPFFSTRESLKTLQINASKQSKHAKSNGFGEICIPVIVLENRSNEYWVLIKVKAHIIEVLDCIKKTVMSMDSAYLTTPR